MTTHAYLRPDEHRDHLEQRLAQIGEVATLLAQLGAFDKVEVHDVPHIHLDKRPEVRITWFPTDESWLEVQFDHRYAGRPSVAAALREVVAILETGIDDDPSRRWRFGGDSGGAGVMLFISWEIR